MVLLLDLNNPWLRDFQTQIKPNETQRNTLIVAGVFIINGISLLLASHGSVQSQYIG
jgi:hypothetical protein